MNKHPSLKYFCLTRFSLQFYGMLIGLLAIPYTSFAEAPKITFEENKNQWPSQVMFKADIRGGSLFLEKNTFTYLYKEPGNFHGEERDPKDTVRIKFHCFKTHFENSNPNTEVSGDNLMEGYRNYYLGNDPGKWAEKVRMFTGVHYRSLYPSIDLNVYTAEENLKYDIIIHPGGNPKKIKINYTGTDKMYLEYGHLHIQTSVGKILEQKPYAYQVVNGEKKQIACSYVLKNTTLSFQLGKYDASLPLVIDPAVIASTYSGSTVDNRGFTATYDAAGNVYTGGMAIGNGYPLTAGGFQQVHNGGIWDAVLSKFNPTGSTLLFSTYYGGSGAEQPHSIFVNGNNELYVTGRTNSTDFPITAGVYQPALAGLYDIFVGKVSSTGGLLASTYIGGTGDDCINMSIGNIPFLTLKFNRGDDSKSEIILDASSNVYVAGCTQSTNFPTSAGAYDNSLSGTQDAVIFKMNSSLTSLLFSTYLGGSGYEAGYGLKTDNTNKVYVTGGTSSNDFPIPVAGVLNPVFGGDVDGYIAVFDPALSGPGQLLRSTYLGTILYDQSYLIEIDASNDLYVYGQTKGAYPVTAGAFHYPIGNPEGGMFIHKLTGNLSSTVFSTVIGTGGYTINLSPTAFLVDSCQTIFISGFGRCSSPWAVPDSGATIGLPITPNAFQSATDGCDLYFAVLTPNAKSLYYATHYGDMTAVTPDHVDGGTSRFDKRGVVYHSACASCGSAAGAFPTTPTAYSDTNYSTCNDAVVKIDMSVQPIAKANITSATKGCAPFTVTFDNTGSTANYYIWDFGDGGTSISPSPSYTYNFAGTYSITLFAIDSVGICGFIDTSIVVVTVGKAPALIATATNFLCNPGVSSATVTATNGLAPYTYVWSPTGGNANVAGGLTAGGIYTVTVTDAGQCTSTKTVNITQPPALTIAVTTTASVCSFPNGSATATVTGGSPGYSYNWSSSQTTPTATGMGAGVYTITVTDNSGCTKAQAIIIGAANGPTVTATATGIIICNGANTGSASASTTGGTAPFTYQWSPGTAGSSQTANGLTGGTYFIVVTDSLGCVGVDSVSLLEPTPLTIGFNVVQVACTGGNNGSATAIVSGGNAPYTYAWGTSPLQTNPTAVGLTAGNYSVLVTDSKGCTNTNSVAITPQPGTLVISATASGTACGTNSNAVITSNVSNGSPTYTYSWQPGGQTTPNISNALGGTHTVSVTDGNNCVATTTVAVPAGSTPPIANFTFTPSISCEGMNVQFTDSSTNALTWLWDFGGTGSSTEQHPGFTFPYSGNYTVTLIVANPPCEDTLSVPLVIGDLGSGIVFSDANVFTPNNDGINDCFHPAMINSATGLPDNALRQCMFLEVFDRWGVKMYESIGLNGINCWDGNNKLDTKPAPDGTYYYIAELGTTLIKGYITLARHK